MGTDSLTASMEAITGLEPLFDFIDGLDRRADRRYARHLIRSNDHSHVLLICWRSGAAHAHSQSPPRAVGSMRVLRGVATETHFEFTPSGLLKPTGSCDVKPGEVTTLQDPFIHQISNLQEPGHDLITLHVYSPPLPKMDSYSLTDRHIGEFRPTDFEHTLSSGI